jgi:hypothetical protein
MLNVSKPPRLKGYERWKKAPSDGTSYVYWILGAETCREGGFLIETKPRFRNMPYSLYLPYAIALMPGYGIPYERLIDAKAAAELPVDSLQQLQRSSIISFFSQLASWGGSSAEDRIKAACCEHSIDWRLFFTEEASSTSTEAVRSGVLAA